MRISKLSMILIWTVFSGVIIFTSTSYALFLPEKVINPEPVLAPSSVIAKDLDNDGDLDLAVALYGGNRILWYENKLDENSSDKWVKYDIGFADEPVSVYAAKIDNDDFVDVLSASHRDSKISWFQNPGIAGEPWVEHVVTTSAASARGVSAADLDNDSDFDIISASAHDDKVAWYENVDGVVSGIPKIISTSTNHVQTARAADIDRDGKIDVVSASIDDCKIAWYENKLGEGSGNDWLEHYIGYADGARDVSLTDIDGDNDIDVVSSSISDDKVIWWQNTLGEGSGDEWIQHLVSNTIDYAYSVYTEDFDNDGDKDIVAASYNGHRIVWFENIDGLGSYAEHLLTDSINYPFTVHAADIDGDKDIDIISTSGTDNSIVWFENYGCYFKEYQSIPTNRAFDWESFVINGETYLAVINEYNGSSFYIDSKIYKWNGTVFNEVQAIPTKAATDWEYFKLNDQHYLALANYYDGDSKIYKWNGSEFEEFQSLATEGAMDFESIIIDNLVYLAVANYGDNSKIFKWNGSSFVEFQSIPTPGTPGARDWESFEIDGVPYLAVANERNSGGFYDVPSTIYKWDGNLFVEFQSINMNRAFAWESFVINNETYLAVANISEPSSNYTNSQ